METKIKISNDDILKIKEILNEKTTICDIQKTLNCGFYKAAIIYNKLRKGELC